MAGPHGRAIPGAKSQVVNPGKIFMRVLKYVLTKYPDAENRVYNDLHLWIREMLQENQDAESEVIRYIEENPDCILICDEIGNGIVPVDAFERRYREQVGRILIEVAKRADRVERVICGLGQRIK